MELLFQGAESKIYTKEYLGKVVLVKERFAKAYRNAQLDSHLTKERIKAECRNIVRCKQAGIKTPAIYFVDLHKRLIFMEYFRDSKTLKQVIDEAQSAENGPQTSTLEMASKQLGENLAKMHSRGIVHGDLTSSNILIVHEEMILIDFGLSSSNASAEDKGVDLYVLERALLSTHANANEIFTNILEAYKKAYGGGQCKEVLAKFEDVRARGRKRTMVG